MATQEPRVPVPIEIRWLADAVGEELTFRFVEAHGGQKIWVPNKYIESSRLAQTWGAPLAHAVAARHGGTHYGVPLLKPWRIRRLALTGLSHNDIAVRVGVARCQVLNTLRGISGQVRAVRSARQIDPAQITFGF